MMAAIGRHAFTLACLLAGLQPDAVAAQLLALWQSLGSEPDNEVRRCVV